MPETAELRGPELEPSGARLVTGSFTEGKVAAAMVVAPRDVFTPAQRARTPQHVTLSPSRIWPPT